MRKSFRRMSSIFLILVAFSVFLFAITTSFARSTNVPPSSLSNSYGFGLQGGIQAIAQSSGLLPADALPNASVSSSLNWAGFYVGTSTGSGFKQVTGNWSTPCMSGPINSNHLTAQWIGIGGIYGSQHLLQVGTVLLTDARFHPFYELFPSPPVISGQAFSCGNNFTAEADYGVRSTGTNKNHISIKNLTTGFTLDYIVPDSKFKPDTKSAEWVDERPSCKSGLTDLADFHYVNWTNPQARGTAKGAGLSPIRSFTNSSIVMQDNKHHTLAKPDGLNSNNTFKDRWYGAGSDGHC